MASFYYFLPGVEQDEIAPPRDGHLNLGLVDRLGLSTQFKLSTRFPDQVIVSYGQGPSGTAGTILYPHPAKKESSPEIVGFDEERQRWIETDNYWIGADLKNPPSISDLQHRYSLIDSYDSEGWKIPIIRSPIESRSEIEPEFHWDKSFRMSAVISDEDRLVWDLAGRCLDHIAGKVDMSDEELAMSAVKFMQRNYRVGIAEIGLLTELGLIRVTRSWCLSIIGVACDVILRQEQEELKKKEMTTEATTVDHQAIG